jgi:hypothetical protein
MPTSTTNKQSPSGLSPLLTRFSQRVSKDLPAVKGGIHIICTDCDEEYSVENLGRAARVAATKSPEAPIVRITAPSSVLQDVLEGRLEASQALVRGGVRVRGDLHYLEGVLRGAGLLSCE